MATQLILACAPTFKRDFARIVGYRKCVTSEGFVKGANIRIVGFAYGDTCKRIRKAAAAGTIGKNTRVLCRLKKADRANSYFVNDISLSL